MTAPAVTPGRVEKMSKSKKNVVDPDKIVETYGADAARLFVVSDTPVRSATRNGPTKASKARGAMSAASGGW